MRAPAARAPVRGCRALLSLVCLLALPGALTACGCDGIGGGEDPPPEVARPYDESADASAAIAAALAASRDDGKTVLLLFGANWCPWCRRLEHLLRNDPAIGRELAEGFHLVHVDVGGREVEANTDVIVRYGDPVQHGIPVFVVLGSDGRVVATRETGSLEGEGERHDPAAVLALLRESRRR